MFGVLQEVCFLFLETGGGGDDDNKIRIIFHWIVVAVMFVGVFKGRGWNRNKKTFFFFHHIIFFFLSLQYFPLHYNTRARSECIYSYMKQPCGRCPKLHKRTLQYGSHDRRSTHHSPSVSEARQKDHPHRANYLAGVLLIRNPISHTYK